MGSEGEKNREKIHSAGGYNLAAKRNNMDAQSRSAGSDDDGFPPHGVDEDHAFGGASPARPHAAHSGFRASKFKQHKEELYDLIAEANANSAATWQDRLMLHHLCSQIEPRPNDPQWHSSATGVHMRKVFGLKKWIAYTSFTVGVVTSLIAVFGLAPNPKIVEYEGHLVTAESVPMLQERLRKQDGYQRAATAGECTCKQGASKTLRSII
ncbi:uncharacterized protein LOC119351017 [Triticum dicoccoides]|uniref:uncharacterized protein LOC119351017 n=1 Tax=Triticum dicoccoides TaxID=85692 RepID=UPI0018902B51|nr:uncharacterized protein LOC119351017 [Triticum dicoccoides]